jgi:hypothetical protein
MWDQRSCKRKGTERRRKMERCRKEEEKLKGRKKTEIARRKKD